MYSGSIHMSYPWWPSPHSARQKTLVESLAWLRETRPLWIGLSQNILAFSVFLSLSLSPSLSNALQGKDQPPATETTISCKGHAQTEALIYYFKYAKLDSATYLSFYSCSIIPTVFFLFGCFLVFNVCQMQGHEMNNVPPLNFSDDCSAVCTWHEKITGYSTWVYILNKHIYVWPFFPSGPCNHSHYLAYMF